MTGLEMVTLAVVVIVLLGWYLSYTAARLHRLHTRAEGALAALDAQLVRRAEASVELANSGALDPATSLILAAAAIDCLDASAEEMTSGDWTEGNLAQREALESALSEAIRYATIPEPASGAIEEHDDGSADASRRKPRPTQSTRLMQSTRLIQWTRLTPRIRAMPCSGACTTPSAGCGSRGASTTTR